MRRLRDHRRRLREVVEGGGERLELLGQRGGDGGARGVEGVALAPGVRRHPERRRPRRLDVRLRRVAHELDGGAIRRARGGGGGGGEQRVELLRRQRGGGAGGEAEVDDGGVAVAVDGDVGERGEVGVDGGVHRRGRLPELEQPLGLGVDHLERRQRGARRVRGERRREAVARAREALVRDDRRRARAEAADRAERVLERADEHVDRARRQVVVLGEAAPRRAERAERERLVDDQVEAEALAQRDERGEVCRGRGEEGEEERGEEEAWAVRWPSAVCSRRVPSYRRSRRNRTTSPRRGRSGARASAARRSPRRPPAP